MMSIWKLQCKDNDDEPLFFTTKQKAEEYLYSSARDYYEGKIVGLLKIEFLD
jgi:hypothetical protein